MASVAPERVWERRGIAWLCTVCLGLILRLAYVALHLAVTASFHLARLKSFMVRAWSQPRSAGAEALAWVSAGWVLPWRGSGQERPVRSHVPRHTEAHTTGLRRLSELVDDLPRVPRHLAVLLDAPSSLERRSSGETSETSSLIDREEAADDVAFLVCCAALAGVSHLTLRDISGRLPGLARDIEVGVWRILSAALGPTGPDRFPIAFKNHTGLAARDWLASSAVVAATPGTEESSEVGGSRSADGSNLPQSAFNSAAGSDGSDLTADDDGDDVHDGADGDNDDRSGRVMAAVRDTGRRRSLLEVRADASYSESENDTDPFDLPNLPSYDFDGGSQAGDEDDSDVAGGGTLIEHNRHGANALSGPSFGLAGGRLTTTFDVGERVGDDDGQFDDDDDVAREYAGLGSLERGQGEGDGPLCDSSAVSAVGLRHRRRRIRGDDGGDGGEYGGGGGGENGGGRSENESLECVSWPQDLKARTLAWDGRQPSGACDSSITGQAEEVRPEAGSCLGGALGDPTSHDRALRGRSGLRVTLSGATDGRQNVVSAAMAVARSRLAAASAGSDPVVLTEDDLAGILAGHGCRPSAGGAAAAGESGGASATDSGSESGGGDGSAIAAEWRPLDADMVLCIGCGHSAPRYRRAGPVQLQGCDPWMVRNAEIVADPGRVLADVGAEDVFRYLACFAKTVQRFGK